MENRRILRNKVNKYNRKMTKAIEEGQITKVIQRNRRNEPLKMTKHTIFSQ